MNKEKTKCSECGSELRTSEVRKNYPFGKKSKPRKTGRCRRCKYPEEAKKLDKTMAKIMEKKEKKK